MVDKTDNMTPKARADETRETPKTPQQSVEDDTPDNGMVVNAESIKANLSAALELLKKYDIPAPAGAAGLVNEGVNGLNIASLQAIIDKLDGAKRAAGAAALPAEMQEGLSLVGLPLKPRNPNDRGGGGFGVA